MNLPEYYVRFPDAETARRAAELRGVPVGSLEDEEGLGFAEFENRSDAHDFAESRMGRVYARRDIRLLSDEGSGNKAWGYVAVYLPDRSSGGP